MRTMLLPLVGLVLNTPLIAQGTREDYARAERFLPWNADSLVLNERVAPRWIGETDRFWYARDLPDGTEFVLVNPAAGTLGPAFDHARLAQTLSDVLDRAVEPNDLPFDAFTFSDAADSITFSLQGDRWSCALVDYTCGKAQPDPPDGTSPDGKWTGFVRDYDLYLRSTESGREIRLTDDGTRDWPWATRIPSPTLMVRQGTEEPEAGVAVAWSPDSRRLSTIRISSRGAGTLSMVQHAPPDQVRPKHYTYFYPLPEDSILPTAEYFIFEIGTWEPVRIPLEPVPLQYYGGPRGVQWDERGEQLRLVVTDRGYTRREVFVVDAATGMPRRVIEEIGEPYVDIFAGTQLRFLADGAEMLWGSERDGWRHLYLYDGVGQVKRQVTSGEWVVRGIEHVNEQRRLVWFTAIGREPGRDPYLRHVYRVGLDGGTPRLLTPEDADHAVSFSPTGTWFVDTYSRPHIEPVSVLRRASDGSVAMELERADISRLLATGWRRPEPFRAKARDGTTDVYGLVWWPSGLDTTKTYPVVEQIYTGPHGFFVPKTFSAYRSTAQTIAELGFVVVQVDGLGTAGRGREFHLYSWKNLGDGGIDDHIAAMRQLAAEHPFIDLTRVGIFGHSAGGYDATHAILTHPDFYDVAVSSAGNHDNRMDKAVWNVQWMGWPVGEHYREQSNVTLADRLQGKLFLAHGDVDQNVPVSATLQLVNALIAANKDFDLLILPNRAHGFGRDPYFIRRRWDFFVRHLLGVEPPAGYSVTGSVEN